MSWKEFIQQETRQPYFLELSRFLQEDAKQHTIFPPHKDVFNAFKSSPLDQTKAVILGQDPYHGEGQAHGLSFSVLPGTDIPPSLRNIYKELQSDLGIPIPDHGCLSKWSQQGVLLLNATLTVRQGQAGSHQEKGWEVFTDAALQLVSQLTTPVVYVLWGASARKKKQLLTNQNHLVIESAHPSPRSAYNGFFGSKPFSQANQFLSDNGVSPIDWSL